MFLYEVNLYFLYKLAPISCICYTYGSSKPLVLYTVTIHSEQINGIYVSIFTSSMRGAGDILNCLINDIKLLPDY
jgi:hypothetical protein